MRRGHRRRNLDGSLETLCRTLTITHWFEHYAHDMVWLRVLPFDLQDNCLVTMLAAAASF